MLLNLVKSEYFCDTRIKQNSVYSLIYSKLYHINSNYRNKSNYGNKIYISNNYNEFFNLKQKP